MCPKNTSNTAIEQKLTHSSLSTKITEYSEWRETLITTINE